MTSMLFLLVHNEIESLNYFTEEIGRQLENMGHIVSFTSREGGEAIIASANAVICYDCMIPLSCVEMCNKYHTPLINILMDHPMNLISSIKNAPEKNIQLSPDENHVCYAKKYIGVKNAFFMPHMASACSDFHYLSNEERNITVLFPAGRLSCNELYESIRQKWASSPIISLLMFNAMEYLISKPWNTLEDALNICLAERHMELPNDAFSSLMAQCKDVDYFIRSYFREKVVVEIIKAGIPISIIGGGWNNLKCITQENVTLLAGRKFAEIFPYMERAQITLTVMPWFKAGTHDRIFNALMHYSCPLTDESSWLLENLKPDEECAYYSLSKLAEIPSKIYSLLAHPEQREKIVENGRRKVLSHFTSKQITEQILYRLKECYG